jgi:hypothetical protein
MHDRRQFACGNAGALACIGVVERARLAVTVCRDEELG